MTGRRDGDAVAGDAVHEIARQVEHEVAAAGSGAEEHCIGLVLGQERRGKLRTDLVGAGSDAGADRDRDALAPSAEPFHGGDGRVDDAAQRALPAGMRRADHAGVGIGQQHGRAIGGEHAQHDARPVGHQAIGLGRARRTPAVLGHGQHVGRMDLVHGLEVGLAQAELLGHAAAVLAHVVGRVGRAIAAVER